MKVLHVIPSVAPRDGGPSHAIFPMCKAIALQGVEPTIVTTDADGSGRLAVCTGRIGTYEGVPTIFFRRQVSQAFKYSRPLGGWLRHNVRSFDVVHIHAVFSHACVAAAMACARSGVPYVVRPLGTLTGWSLAQKPLRKRVAWHLGVGKVVRQAAAVHYTTPGERRSTQAATGLPGGEIIGLGVDETAFAAGAEAGRNRPAPAVHTPSPYVILLGRIHPKKCLDVSLGALIAFLRRPDYAAWRVVVAGDGDARYVAWLRQFVEDRGGRDLVTFTGWLDRRGKYEALHAAGLLVLCSHDENFGLSVAEALACGVPVLVTDQVGIAEDVLTAQAGWVALLREDAIVDALAVALGNADERARRGAAGRALASRRYRWDGIGAALVQLYRSVLLASASGEPVRRCERTSSQAGPS